MSSTLFPFRQSGFFLPICSSVFCSCLQHHSWKPAGSQEWSSHSYDIPVHGITKSLRRKKVQNKYVRWLVILVSCFWTVNYSFYICRKKKKKSWFSFDSPGGRKVKNYSMEESCNIMNIGCFFFSMRSQYIFESTKCNE